MGGEMERCISSLCASLSTVLDHADFSSRELADAVSRRPIHLESATTAFLQKLHRLEGAAGADLQHLESMVFGAVSLEELLGHCGEALHVYARHADAIESRLASLGYEPPEVEPEVHAEDGGAGDVVDPGNGGFSDSSSMLRSDRWWLNNDDDALFGGSLKNLGFSDATLATLSSEATDYSESPKKFYKNPESADAEQKIVKEPELIAPQNERNDQVNSMKAIFLIRQLMERYREQKNDLHMVFIDLEKAYDKVPRNVMWWALEKHKVPTKYITLIKDMYKDATTFVRTCDGDTTDFPINIGLHQGSALSPYLFALVLDEVTRDIQGSSFEGRIRASQEEYEQLPPYMKSLAS